MICDIYCKLAHVTYQYNILVWVALNISWLSQLVTFSVWSNVSNIGHPVFIFTLLSFSAEVIIVLNP